MEPRGSVGIGIDQSYSGFAITALGENSFHTIVYKAPGSGIDRLMHIHDWLGEIFEHYSGRINDVAFEAPVRMSHAALMSGELVAIVKAVCWKYLDEPGKYPLQVPPLTLKKYTTGKGQGVQKNQMLLQVYKKWGVEFDDDNAADSYALARLISGIADTSYEKDVLKKLDDLKFRDQRSF